MVHHKVCPLCLSENILPHLRCTDQLVSKEVFEIFRCFECGFLFTQDNPERNSIGQYYDSDDYISHSDTSKGLSNKIYRLARNFMLQKKRGIIRRVSGLKSGKILDIGSGTGHFANTMKQAGWDVKGIEINEKARIYSITCFGLDITGPEMMNSLEANSFDIITLWHVLEHFHDPFQYASDIFRLLKPGGICLIALPNCNSYDALYYKEYWAAYDVPRHLWHFNPLTLRTFSQNSGFLVEDMRSLPLDLFYISILSEKYMGSKLPFLVGLIKSLPFALSSVFNKEKSSSVFYILRKP